MEYRLVPQIQCEDNLDCLDECEQYAYFRLADCTHQCLFQLYLESTSPRHLQKSSELRDHVLLIHCDLDIQMLMDRDYRWS